MKRGRRRVSWWGEQHHQRGRAYASTRSRFPRYTERCLLRSYHAERCFLRSTSRANALTIQSFPTSVQELSSELTVLTFKLSNQIEPFYLQYSSHTDGHNSRYVDTTAILRTHNAFRIRLAASSTPFLISGWCYCHALIIV